MEVDFDELVTKQLDPNDPSQSRSQAEHAALLSSLDRATRSRQLVVPTNESAIRIRLRELGEPMTLFGERPEDRRDRLRYVLSQIAEARGWELEKEPGAGQDEENGEDEDMKSDDENEEFYTEGSEELLSTRRFIAEFSLANARKRITRQKLEANLPLSKIMAARKAIYAELKTYTNLGSQVGDERPISMVRFSPNSQILATGSWTGTAKIWNVPSCTPYAEEKDSINVFKGHSDRIGGLAWHPGATLTQSSSSVNLMTGGADSKVQLWSLKSDQPLRTLEGHTARVCRVAFHPAGRHAASSSFDTTWRLWDIETGNELLVQEGHSREVYSLEFQSDGALLCSGGLDAIGRVWDLRSGKTVMVLDGHVKDILAIDFSPNGHQIATGSNDDNIRIWDIRTLKPVYTIPAHTSAVSDVKFFRASAAEGFKYPYTLDVDGKSQEERKSAASFLNGSQSIKTEEGAAVSEIDVEVPLSGLYLASCGYDGYVKLWSADDWQLIKALSSEAGGKVMSVDIARDGKFMASGEWTRTFKLWSAENVSLL
ncbi:serine/threonine-protein kinase PRP4 [Phakopsora pachyrhizi]|uniref:Serine/threonine-protein kinase PRP4 n=1 Tax=Phakopsora pachyrhizi TaxID=170000 RepID=A0AAV0BJ26_PHAPC|nr:serine/threonine-protein kinase PRP4 [Phakopsora pachyrhizi]CAH7686117.1 serine/threonine-protein kinase PRP4 [Phakopsora pachyrhizi]